MTPCAIAHQAPLGCGNSPGKNTGVGCHTLLQGIFLTEGLNPGFLHCRQILYHLSHQGSPRILEWVAMPSSRGSSQPRDVTQVSCVAGEFLAVSLPVGQLTERQGVEARNTTLFGEPADQEEGRLMSQNNRLVITLWMPLSVIEQRGRKGEEVK